jgi:hypothetical protein
VSSGASFSKSSSRAVKYILLTQTLHHLLEQRERPLPFIEFFGILLARRLSNNSGYAGLRIEGDGTQSSAEPARKSR